MIYLVSVSPRCSDVVITIPSLEVRNQRQERLSSSPEITQPVSGRSKIQTQVNLTVGAQVSRGAVQEHRCGGAPAAERGAQVLAETGWGKAGASSDRLGAGWGRGHFISGRPGHLKQIEGQKWE